jgi:hypothetical protein
VQEVEEQVRRVRVVVDPATNTPREALRGQSHATTSLTEVLKSDGQTERPKTHPAINTGDETRFAAELVNETGAIRSFANIPRPHILSELEVAGELRGEREGWQWYLRRVMSCAFALGRRDSSAKQSS